MAFFNDDEKKEFGSKFFQWEDKKTYHMTVSKKVEVNFATGKKTLILVCEDLDTGEVTEQKFQWSLQKALEDLGDAYVDERTMLNVTSIYGGKGKEKPNKPGEFYDVWKFEVSVIDPIQDLVDKGQVAKHDAEVAPELA
jgi:hypothetical protein